MNTCEFNPENCTEDQRNNGILCPRCNHFIILGLPHPDFSSAEMPINNDELTNLSQAILR